MSFLGTWYLRISRMFLALLALTMVVSCGQQRAPERGADSFMKIKKERLITVGYMVAPPFVVRDPDSGRLSGTFVDTLNEITREMEVKVEFVEVTLATFVAGLESKKFDLSIAPTFTTIPRAKSVAFTRPLLALGNSAIVRKGDERFKTLHDIDREGIVVAVTQGEQGYEYAKTHFKKAKLKILSVGDQALTFSEVLASRADVALGDAWFTAKFAATHPEARDLFAEKPYNVTPVAWAVRYSDLALLTFVNTCLDYLDSTGKLEEIDRKYDVKWLRPKKVWEKS